MASIYRAARAARLAHRLTPAPPPAPRRPPQKLEENAMLLRAINENQSVGRLDECVSYHQRLQANLMELAALADAQAAPLPAPQ